MSSKQFSSKFHCLILRAWVMGSDFLDSCHSWKPPGSFCFNPDCEQQAWNGAKVWHVESMGWKQEEMRLENGIFRVWSISNLAAY